MKKMVVLLLALFLFPYSVNALEVSGRTAILMDMDSGRILYQKNMDEARLIASITKIMTAVLAIESEKLDEIVTVGEEVLTMYGSNIYIELNEKMSLRDLLYGLMLRSGNDAAIVIATYVGGNEENFVKMMNEKAKEIGMKNTVYRNSHGLDEVTENYSSAHDMALLSSYANQLEEYRKIAVTKKYIVKGESKTYIWKNRNELLTSYEAATGGKTGYTPRAGHTLVTTASKNNLNLTAVTLDDGNMYLSHKSLFEYGFNNYTSYKIIDKDTFYMDKAYFKDTVYVKNSFSYPLLAGEEEKIKVIAQITKTKGYKDKDQVGEVLIKLDNEEIHKEPIYVSVPKKVNKSWWQKFLDLFS